MAALVPPTTLPAPPLTAAAGASDSPACTSWVTATGVVDEAGAAAGALTVPSELPEADAVSGELAAAGITANSCGDGAFSAELATDGAPGGVTRITDVPTMAIPLVISGTIGHRRRCG
ncbi:MAG TPA: hypothetical protein VHO06_07575 [Polyangia bacterium]|nr:hypothetical protein [Polyangia bacterium]